MQANVPSFDHSDLGTLIPRSNFRGLRQRGVKYQGLTVGILARRFRQLGRNARH